MGKHKMIHVEIICCGDVGTAVLDYVADGLERELGAAVTLSYTTPVPADAYNPERDQYSSTRILELLCHPTPPQDRVRLVVTDVDLYVSQLNFVFGEAHPASRCCIISLARLGLSYDGITAGPELSKERALKEAVHEIGHLLGLGHCTDSRCVMFFSNSILDTDRKGHSFCERCRRRLPSTEDTTE
jgi:archaemetzincin